MSKNIGLGEWKMVATSFEGIGATGGMVRIADAIKCDANPVPFANIDTATQILLWIETMSGSGYKYIYYLSDALNETAFNEALDQNDDYLNALDKAEAAEMIEDWDEAEKWYKEADRIANELKPSYQTTGWADTFGNLTDQAVALGTSYWYFDADKADSATFSGQVPAAPSIDLDMYAGWTMICNPYPSAVNYSDVAWTGITPVTFENMDNGAQLLVPVSGGGYIYQYYLSDALNEAAFNEALDQNDDYLNALDKAEAAEMIEDWDEAEKWYKEADRIANELKPSYQTTGWADTFGNLKTGVIQDAGLGFWLMLPAGSETVTATFAHP